MQSFNLENYRDYFKDSYSLEQLAEALREATVNDNICSIKFNDVTVAQMISANHVERLLEEKEKEHGNE